MLTVDFDLLGVRAGQRVLDLGCGAGRHSYEYLRRGADVVAFDQDTEALAEVETMFGAMAAADMAKMIAELAQGAGSGESMTENQQIG